MPAPVLPRDALGVTLLVVCAAMALDILAPWSESYSVRQSLVGRFGHPAFVVVAMALVAALPLYRPQWRRSPLCAAAPLVLGALSVGVGLTYYIFLARENSQAVNAIAGGYPPLEAQTSSGTPISPQLGLYLFILIGVVLIVTGYQLFLAAVRSQYVLIGPVPAQPMTMAQIPPASSAPVLTPAMIAQVSATNVVPSPASIPLGAAPTLSASLERVPMAFAPAAPSQAPLPAPQLGQVPIAPSTPLSPVVVEPAITPTPATVNGSAKKGLVLPGTDAWNEEPVSPVVTKQSRMRGGWRYSSR